MKGQFCKVIFFREIKKERKKENSNIFWNMCFSNLALKTDDREYEKYVFLLYFLSDIILQKNFKS